MEKWFLETFLKTLGGMIHKNTWPLQSDLDLHCLPALLLQNVEAFTVFKYDIYSHDNAYPKVTT